MRCLFAHPTEDSRPDLGAYACPCEDKGDHGEKWRARIKCIFIRFGTRGARTVSIQFRLNGVRSMSGIGISQQLVDVSLVLFRGRYGHSHDRGEHSCNCLLFAVVDGKGIRRANCQRPPCFLHLRSSHKDLARSGREEVHL